MYLSGEAFFRVAHDAAHPFRVLTAHLETRVLGTSFTVRAYPQQAGTVVQVRTGRVRVSPRRPAPTVAQAQNRTLGPAVRALVLLPNQQAVYAPGRQQLRRELTPQPVLLAPQPFAFDNRPVAEVLEALKTAYGVDIRYSPAAVAGCTVNLHRQASLRQARSAVPGHGSDLFPSRRANYFPFNWLSVNLTPEKPCIFIAIVCITPTGGPAARGE
ncbi:FecR family protein [Hymenobacter nivis]|uniref:FecR protein domain-containing protein n=1 Tax=Hymenobacter nivis TaxID=1850093 RepID=A0A2Z3GJR1_9BACT|nr:FecR domain-containing protein [Hymenobacter nivis]AWM34429.1 hypothetical protein DDQ68_17535 [Hymenobacter nivis]